MSLVPPPTDDKDFVYLAVPVRLHKDLVSFLNDKLNPPRATLAGMDARNPADSFDNAVALHPMAPDTPEECWLGSQGKWTPGMLDAVRIDIEERPAIKYMVDSMAAGRKQNIDHIQRNTGLSPSRIKSQLSSFSKATKRIFGQVRWPFLVSYDPAGKAAYRMHPQMQEWWRRGPSYDNVEPEGGTNPNHRWDQDRADSLAQAAGEMQSNFEAGKPRHGSDPMATDVQRAEQVRRMTHAQIPQSD